MSFPYSKPQKSTWLFVPNPFSALFVENENFRRGSFILFLLCSIRETAKSFSLGRSRILQTNREPSMKSDVYTPIHLRIMFSLLAIKRDSIRNGNGFNSFALYWLQSSSSNIKLKDLLSLQRRRKQSGNLWILHDNVSKPSAVLNAFLCSAVIGNNKIH